MNKAYGYRAWQKNFERHVKKGERGIRILAPTPFTIKEEREKIDPLTREPVVDKDGMPVMEEVDVKIPAFQVVTVFDVSQTEGKELPDLTMDELTANMDGYRDFMQALSDISPVPITYEDMSGEEKGYYHQEEKRIAIKEGMSESQTAKTGVHEVSHAVLHDRDLNRTEDDLTDRNTKEVQAESIAYIVCQRFGIDTSDYSFGYIASWSSGRDMKELKASLNTIRKTASELITGIENRMQALQKERETEQGRNMEKMEQENQDKVSYYVIGDLSTWANNSKNRSPLERLDNLYDALGTFCRRKAECGEYPDDKARATLGVSINGREFDLLHVREGENYLVQDFTLSETAKESQRFFEDLQTIHDVIGFDKTRIHREMTPEEVKDFVKRRFEYQLKSNGIEDTSLYMKRFDSLYEKGAMENLMPTANQRQVTDIVAVPEWENPYFTSREPEQLAYAVGDYFVSIQTCEDGYDYSVLDGDYRLLDGGVYDNPDIPIKTALKGILEDITAPGEVLLPVDYDTLTQQNERVEQERLSERIQGEVPDAAAVKIVADFKAKTDECLHPVNGHAQDEIEQIATAYILSQIDYYDLDASVVDVVVSGSRCRGLEREDSDIDIVVEYKSEESEYAMFDTFNGEGFTIGGIKVDINPIREEETGTLAEYLPRVETYLTEKAEVQKDRTVVTLTVAECGEFHDFGEYHEGIKSVEEALAIYQKIPPERRNGIPSIGVNIHTKGTETYEDVQTDLFSGNVIDLEVLDYIPEVTGNQKAMKIITELVEKLPEAKVQGSLEKYNPLAKVEELEEGNYNMIDGVLNNEKPKKEPERLGGRISIKEKLAEKKAVVEQRGRDGKPLQEAEKKTEREM